MRTTWAGLGERIEELERQVDDLQTIRRNQAEMIKEFHREVAILSEYKRAVLILADAWDVLCVLFEGRGS